jgi:hypothetical protein
MWLVQKLNICFFTFDHFKILKGSFFIPLKGWSHEILMAFSDIIVKLNVNVVPDNIFFTFVIFILYFNIWKVAVYILKAPTVLDFVHSL